MPSHAAKIDGRWHEVPTELEDQCDGAECDRPWAYTVERAWWKRGMSHPSVTSWIGLHMCWDHAQAVERLNERYGLGVFTRRVR